MKVAILLCALLFPACSYAERSVSGEGAEADASENAEPCTSTHGESFATLSGAHGLVGIPSMYETEGDVPRMLSALRCLIEAPDAIAELVRLLDEGSVAGQLYALIGLKVLDPGEFARRLPPYLTKPDRIRLLGGDVAATQDVARVTVSIAEGHYSVLMPASKYSAVKPYINVERVEDRIPSE